MEIEIDDTHPKFVMAIIHQKKNSEMKPIKNRSFQNGFFKFNNDKKLVHQSHFVYDMFSAGEILNNP